MHGTESSSRRGNGDPATSTSGSCGSSGSKNLGTAPKTLSAGVWTTSIRKYEQIQLNGMDRVFPSEILLGAEAVRHAFSMSI